MILMVIFNKLKYRRSAGFSVAVLLVGFVFFTTPLSKAILEAAELGEEFLCDNDSISLSCNGLAADVTANSPFYKPHDSRIFLEQMIFYLEKHENSPPVVIC